MTHREVALRCGATTAALRKWVAKGSFPEPKAIIEATWFYDAAVIESWLATGTWPEGTRFRATGGRGLALARERAKITEG